MHVQKRDDCNALWNIEFEVVTQAYQHVLGGVAFDARSAGWLRH
jgi:hypothetical protein